MMSFVVLPGISPQAILTAKICRCGLSRRKIPVPRQP